MSDNSSLMIITPTFAPRICGIGDHAAIVARHLSRQRRVIIVTEKGASSTAPDFQVLDIWNRSRPWSLLSIAELSREIRPANVLIEYDPFSFGRWGVNPLLPLMAHRIRSSSDRCTSVTVFVHETMNSGHGLRSKLLSAYLLAQLRSVVAAADLVIVAIEDWVRVIQHWFPHKKTIHLPVGSNIKQVFCDRDAMRHRLGVSEHRLCLGLFGRLGNTRSTRHVQESLRRLKMNGRDSVLLYIGIDSCQARREFSEFNLICTGPLSAADVSEHLSAVDVYLVPVVEGVSTRRGTLLAGLQHGLATVATIGEVTDNCLRAETGRSLLLADAGDVNAFSAAVVALADDPARRSSIGGAASRLFEREFAWEQIVNRVESALAIT